MMPTARSWTPSNSWKVTCEGRLVGKLIEGTGTAILRLVICVAVVGGLVGAGIAWLVMR